MRALLLLLLASLTCRPAMAADLKHFDAASLARIEAQHAGKPFILSLWSVNWCGHCIEELTMLGRLARTAKHLPLVLIAVDSPEDSEAIRKTLDRLGLAKAEAWVFDDPIPERLRASIDPAWMGDLPRTYLYDLSHKRQAVLGELDKTMLRAWIKKNLNKH